MVEIPRRDEVSASCVGEQSRRIYLGGISGRPRLLGSLSDHLGSRCRERPTKMAVAGVVEDASLREPHNATQ